MNCVFKCDFFNKYKKNVYSQNGEDGIIEEILLRLGIKDGYVCEFGAFDGIYLSNTFNLIEKGFKGVFIESDLERFKVLLKTAQKYPNITPINALVDFNDTPNSLDNILKKTNIPVDFDILSIDIDSYDYHVWKNLKFYRPKIVIIEINSEIDHEDREHIHIDGKFIGTSFRPMLELGIQKGYKFLLHTGNMIFARDDLFDRIGISYNDPLENFLPIYGANRKYITW